MTVIAQTLTVQKHVIRLVHSATGQPITAVRLAPVAWPTGWAARVVGGAVVVVGPEGGVGPARVDVVITDGAIADLLDLPAPAADQPPDSVRVPLAADAIDVPVDPIALKLVVEVHGDPPPSPTLTAKVTAASGGTTVNLTKDAPGVYSATRVWGANFINADLTVGGQFVRKVSLDYTRAVTRIHVVDPT